MNQRHAAGNRCFEPKLRAVRGGKVQQLWRVRRQQHLVCGHDGGALLQCTAHPGAGRLDATDHFDDRVRLGRKQLVDVLGPRRRTTGPSRRAFARHLG